MKSGFTIRKNRYYDSVFLMGINSRILNIAGVQQAAVVMGTENNKKLLSEIGIHDAQIADAAPNDLIVAVIAERVEIMSMIFNDLDHWFEEDLAEKTDVSVRTLEAGLALKPDANLVVISVPGKYAFRETKKALEKGVNVFLFSDNVPISEEFTLKTSAREQGLLVMGPDCGTSLIGGVGIGFANNVRKGRIGAVGASGTGLQEFTSQVHNAGCGISHAIGTGSHDLSDDIGGITTVTALNALERDPNTQVIAILSKPPGRETLKRIREVVSAMRKPVVGCFLGLHHDVTQEQHPMLLARTIDEAVVCALDAMGAQHTGEGLGLSDEAMQLLASEKGKLAASQKYVRGVFAGGTFCYQAQQIFHDAGFPVYSNTPLNPQWQLSDPDTSQEHTMVDMGDDRYTVSKPHPMIDGTYRRKRIVQESHDPLVAVLCIDIILGWNASPDPVGDILAAISEAKQAAQQRNEHLCVVASVCGTDEDVQDKARQVERLEQAGVVVLHSNAKAALFCSKLVQ